MYSVPLGFDIKRCLIDPSRFCLTPPVTPQATPQVTPQVDWEKVEK